jgi:hypothetical protein
LGGFGREEPPLRTVNGDHIDAIWTQQMEKQITSDSDLAELGQVVLLDDAPSIGNEASRSPARVSESTTFARVLRWRRPAL